MTMTTASYPIAPATSPLQGTLLDAAEVTDDFRWLDGSDLFESYNTMTFASVADFCSPNTKILDNEIPWIDGFRFAAYGGVTCKAVGLDQSKMLSETERVFRLGESIAVEQALMAERFANPTGPWGATSDITPGGAAVSPAVGIALLEEFMARNYVGVPTLHLPRSIASLRAQVNAVEYRGDVLYTALGSKVAAGGGYAIPNLGPDGTSAAAGERWLYATGEVLVGRGPVTIQQAMEITTNDVTVLAERGYIVAVDGFAVAIKVTVTA